MTGTAVARVEQETGEVVSEFSMSSYLAGLSAPAHLAQQQKLAALYDAACAALIGENDVQTDGNRSFKKKSAWRKLARHFNISTDVISVEREVIDGQFLALVTVRASAPWGQHADAVGACCTDEATGRRVITVADAIATAETRATNRATSNLIAMGEVTAEEIGERKGDRQTGNAPSGTKAAPSTATSGANSSTTSAPVCPKCDGDMWDNRQGKRNPKAPDYKCRDRACDGAIWPPKDASAKAPRSDAGPLVPQEPDFSDVPFPDDPPF